MGRFPTIVFTVHTRGLIIYRRKTAAQTDSRVQAMDEIIGAMRVIKMYCWEKPFSDVVAQIRK